MDQQQKPVPKEALLQEILTTLKNIQSRLVRVEKTVAAVDANLDVIRQAHHQNNQRIALIEQRCAERGQAFSKFVEETKTDSSGDGDVERKKG